MDAKLLVTIILYGPLLGAAVAGLFGRRIGDTASMAVTTGFLMLSAVLVTLSGCVHDRATACSRSLSEQSQSGSENYASELDVRYGHPN